MCPISPVTAANPRFAASHHNGRNGSATGLSMKNAPSFSSADNLTLAPQKTALYGTPQTGVTILTLAPGQQFTSPLLPNTAQDWLVMSGQVTAGTGGKTLRLRAGKYGACERFLAGQPVAVRNPSKETPAKIMVLSRYTHQDNPQQLSARPVTEERPWGNFTVLADEPDYKLKELVVKPGGCLSLQRHEKRAEHWFILKGEPSIIKGRGTQTLKAGDYIKIPRHAWHRIDNRNGTQNVVIVELQKGTYFGEDDIERKQDVYGRK